MEGIRAEAASRWVEALDPLLGRPLLQVFTPQILHSQLLQGPHQCFRNSPALSVILGLPQSVRRSLSLRALASAFSGLLGPSAIQVPSVCPGRLI